jgi:hypothetical protein
MAKLLVFKKIAQSGRDWRSHLCARGDAGWGFAGEVEGCRERDPCSDLPVNEQHVILAGCGLFEEDRQMSNATSTTELDPERQQLLLSETHTLVNDAGEHSSDYRFVMRCWTRPELESVFERGGFGSVAYFGAYDPAVHAGVTDRVVAVAQLSDG